MSNVDDVWSKWQTRESRGVRAPMTMKEGKRRQETTHLYHKIGANVFILGPDYSL